MSAAGVRSAGLARWRVLGAVWAACVAACLLGACASAADVRAQQQASQDELEAEADELFAALEAVASRRGLPIARRDAQRRRLTTEWIDEGDGVRRRYFLAVLSHPAGLALHANIVRETAASEDAEGPFWTELERDAAVVAEENEIIEEAYRLWSEGE